MESQYLPIPKAFEKVTGLRPNLSTCWRWRTKGCNGVILQTWMIGQRRYTTAQAVQEFIDLRNAAEAGEHSTTRQKLERELAKSTRRA